MATVISLKRRMKAAQNVSKTTKAMQMISASKLKKAQYAALSTRPYVQELDLMTKNIINAIDKISFNHPYMKSRKTTGKTLLIILAPDKGLCGGLVSNLLREQIAYHKKNPDNSFYIPIGKKIEGYVARLSKDVIATFRFGVTNPTFDVIAPIMKIIDEYYLGGKVDGVKVLFTDFRSFFSQIPTIATLLPIELPVEVAKGKQSCFYVFEPEASEILPDLLRHHVEMTFYHFFLESFVSEQAGRMIAMQNATTNANDIIEDLRLEYNKTRQAKITSELLDITGAAIAAA